MLSKHLITGSLVLATTTFASMSAEEWGYEPYSPIFCEENSCGRFLVDASYLYWSSKVDHMDFVGHVVEDLNLTPTQGPQTIDALIDTTSFGFSWDSGARASIGYQPCDSSWDVKLKGTYFQSKNTKNVTGVTSSATNNHIDILIPLWNPSFVGNSIEAARGTAKLNYGVLDLVVGNALYSCNCFTISPFIGVRAAWIKQNNCVLYENSFFTTNSQANLAGGDARMAYEDLHRAIGIIGGTDFSIPCRCGIGFIGEVSGSLLYGRSRLHQHFQGFNILPGFSGPLSTVAQLTQRSKHTLDQITANFESELGLQYSNCWCGVEVDLSLSYFFGIWFDQNHLNNFLVDANATNGTTSAANYPYFQQNFGNLQLQGLVARIGAKF